MSVSRAFSSTRLHALVFMCLVGTLISCIKKAPITETAPEVIAEVRYRYDAPTDQWNKRLVSEVVSGRWDRGLQRAVEGVLAASIRPGTRIPPSAARTLTAEAGYPGYAAFAQERNGGAWPDELVSQALIRKGQAPEVDVAIGQRRNADGTTLWVLAAAPKWGEIDPIVRDLTLDEPLPLRVDVPDVQSLAVYIAPPNGPVRTFSLTSGRLRWFDYFHLPGAHRIEVVDTSAGRAEVLFLFSVFVDVTPETLTGLPTTLPRADPLTATERLYQAVNILRADAGLPALKRFGLFEPLAREHAAWMAQQGVVAHRLSGAPGVAQRAADQFRPRARHTENVAAAYTAEEALQVVWDSPGHRKNLLCEQCSHISVGVALEPVLDRPPRLFVVWELLEFPLGEPRALPEYAR